MIVLLLLATMLFSWALTYWVRRYALSRRLLDLPNARSSHSVPTPRGGGVAIVAAFLIGLPALFFLGLLEASLMWALLGAGGWVALLGFLDDHNHVPARWRLLGHFAGAVWVLCWLGGMPAIDLHGQRFELGWLGQALALLGLVWLLNLYNFMDGIDGIASIQAVSVCLGGALLYWLHGEASLGWPLIFLGASVSGFLFWNFPPARIFMGDAGSGFLGIALGTFALHAGWVSADLLWAWLILMGVFVVDATWTLLRRLARGERVYEAHRSHAYQFASRRFRKHLPVTITVASINLLWLLPVATLVVLGHIGGVWALLLSYAPLVMLAWYFDAGGVE